MLAVLRHSAFRRIALVQPVDGSIEWASSIALMVLVFGETDSVLASGALLICKQVVPGALTPLAGRILDSARIGPAIALAMVLQAVAIGAVAAGGYGPQVFVLAILAGIGGSLARSSFRAGTGRTLTGADRRAGNALLNMVFGVISLVGPAIAGVALTVVDPRPLLGGLAAAGVVTALIVLVVGGFPGAEGSGAESAENGAGRGADEDEPETLAPPPAWSAVLPVSFVLVLAAVTFGSFSMDEPALLAYSQDSLGAGVGGYGAILGLWGVGMLIGSLGYSRVLGHSMLTVGACGVTVCALAYLVMGFAPTIEVACVAAVVGGVSNGFDWISLVTAVQEATPPDQQGQAATRLEAVATIGPGIGFLVGGLLADATSPRATLIVPGVLALVILALGAAIYAVRSRRLVA